MNVRIMMLVRKKISEDCGVDHPLLVFALLDMVGSEG